jgi:hypothetical protein
MSLTLRAVALPALVATLGLATACTGVATQGDHPSLPAPGALLWSADHETGDLSQWKSRQGSAVFNTGTAEARVVQDGIARSGDYVLRLDIDTAGEPATAARIFRWAENQPRAYYSAWLYFTEAHRPDVFWNVMQFKSPPGSGRTEPTFTINVATDGRGVMRLYLWDAVQGRSHGQRGDRVPLPVGAWVHLEMYLERATDASGRIVVWQDGVRLFDLDGVQTAFTDSIHWSVNSYSDGLSPTRATIYVDDAEIRSVSEEERDGR